MNEDSVMQGIQNQDVEADGLQELTECTTRIKRGLEALFEIVEPLD